MKKNYLPFVLISLFLIASSCRSYDYVIESDYSYKGNFKRYATFKFMEDAASTPTEPFIADILNNQIKRRMELQGYRYDDDKPHLLVAYKVFKNNLRFTGYEQLDFETWLKRNFDEDDDEYDPVKYSLYKGTILVILYDRRKRTSVWQGYASSVLGSSEFNNDKYLSQAVRSIFDQYKVFTQNYLMDQYN